jgi:hypothetical protein
MLTIFNPWLLVGIVLAVAVAGWRGYEFGYDRSEAKHAVAALEQAKVVQALERRIAAITAEASRAAEEHQQQVQVVTRTIVRRIPVYVTPKIDRDFPLPWIFVRLHDASAQRVDLPAIPFATGQSDDAPSDITISRASTVIAENYGAADANAQQLADLQEWLRQQQAAWSKP